MWLTQAKLTALKKKIDAFQAVQAKPRQGRATSSYATKELAKLFKQVDELLNERLDALVVQFKDSQPAFFNAYNTVREVVNAPGGRASKDEVVTPISKTARSSGDKTSLQDTGSLLNAGVFSFHRTGDALADVRRQLRWQSKRPPPHVGGYITTESSPAHPDAPEKFVSPTG